MKKIMVVSGIALFLTIGNITLNAYSENHEQPQIVAALENDPLPEFSEPHVVYYYHRSDNTYNHSLWLWDNTQEGEEYNFTYNLSGFGKYLYVPLSAFGDKTQMNFIIKIRGSWNWQTPNGEVKFNEHTFDETTNAYHFYLLNGSTQVYDSAEHVLGNQVLSNSFTTRTSVKVVTNNKPISYTLKRDNDILKTASTGAVYSSSLYSWSFTIDLGSSFTPDFTKEYSVDVVYETSPQVVSTVGLDGLYDDPYFEENLTYSGSDLGVTYSATKSIFKAWTPTAKSLKLRVYEVGTPVAIDATKGNDLYASYDMLKGGKAVWSVEVPGDLHGKYYTFVVNNGQGEVELTDPYAKSTGINGIRGMIVDFAKTNPLDWDSVHFEHKDETQIVPYELHVSDLTADETWNGNEANRKKFLGLIEEGTTYTSGNTTVKTGFDHIKELGINAVQIIPFYDQANDERSMEFNWGYNPQNYNALEGSYSSDPYDGLVRIREFKQVVTKYAQADIRIIMDVVYNHVASISDHSFSKLVPGYYFRYNNDSPDNSSGVGNVTASERKMMENFMVSSTEFWVKEYKISGFRFDLMGLHTVDAMNAVTTNLNAIRSDIFVIGEAWNMDSVRQASLAHQGHIHLTPDTGAFNDQFRDAVKGGNAGNDSSPGWVQISPDRVSDTVMKTKIKQGLLGKIYGANSSPTQTVNYVACHDNHTLYDKIVNVGTKNSFTLQRMADQSLQADSLTLLSQGVSFIHAGSEILRSKPLEGSPGKFDHNSYKSSYETNSIKWDEKITNINVFNKYKELIKIKQNIAAFQYTTHELVSANVTVDFGGDIGYADNLIKLTAKDANNIYTVYFYGVGSRLRINDIDGLEVVFDSSSKLQNGSLIKGEHTMETNSTIIVKNHVKKNNNSTWIIISSIGAMVAAIGLVVAVLNPQFIKKRRIN